MLRKLTVLGIVIIALMFSAACVGPLKRDPRSIQGLAKEYVVLQGKLASAPQIKEGGDALEIYLGVGEVDPEPDPVLIDEETGEPIEVPGSPIDEVKKFDDIQYCLALNKEEKIRLKDAAELMINAGDRPIFLYAKMIEGRKFMWFYDGLDCVVYAVGVYHVHAKKYITLDTAYGLGWSEALSFKGIVKKILSEGGKAATKAIKP